ncbi:ATP-binding protein [Verminephrobacter aporrectodeae subsp. tuberculatae]|uniref:AAA family ATPase n=1 Tax=Verminephrobacter aporrectodeae TaxID=1110389 RepID=UPI002237D610|nr:ATP-binding protein [Verminephrobacter aporrectodeae]MCW5222243.1 ATP-binding protein [Verminephrobacter aporrectodeae subsp. tuberculatae]MCW5287707.1 ATP-binding protein [Verminephrobacter aporrectodeae subsp. tuberculatae]
MAQADLLVDLLKTATRGDQLAFRKIAEGLIQEEKQKGHRLLAERMTKALQANTMPFARYPAAKMNAGSTDKELFYEIVPERDLDSLVLPEEIKVQVQEFIEEQHRSELLHAHNLRARSKILLAGPPGNGKTTLAEALAFQLMYPLIVIRYETLVGSYLGETSSRLKSVLEYARTQRCVLFFDEFETLGKERGDIHETGEIKRVVSSFLLQLDDMPDYVVVVAASNHPELLDKAVWRRFQLRIELPMPTHEQLTHYIASIEKRCGVSLGIPSQDLAKQLLGSNFSEAEEFCLGVVRRAMLEMKTENTKPLTQRKIEQWKSRLKPAHENTKIAVRRRVDGIPAAAKSTAKKTAARKKVDS